MINWRGWDCPACMELNCENLHFPLQDGSLQHYSLNNSLFLVPAFYSLNCSLAGARSQISTTCISKNSKDPYLVLQSHIFKSSVCASDFKIIENRGFKRGKKTPNFSFKMFELQLIPKPLKQLHRKEDRNHTQPTAQPVDGQGGRNMLKMCTLPSARLATLAAPDPLCSTPA